MKKVITALCLIPSLIWGLTFESNQMQDVLPYVDPLETWVLIDIDNTLIESSVYLGSAPWRHHIRNKAQNAGYSESESEKILDQFWLFVQPLIPVRLVDPKTPALLHNLQESRTPVLALTAREPIEIQHTQKQIDSVAIHLVNDFPGQFSLSTNHPALYANGVIYCGDNSKAETLIAFFQATGRMPKKVVFVDDRWDQVENLEVELEKLGIQFVGMRFGGADKRMKAFNPAIADLQFSQLPKIVSDEEAKEALLAK
jgi:hypothetical protein